MTDIASIDRQIRMMRYQMQAIPFQIRDPIQVDLAQHNITGQIKMLEQQKTELGALAAPVPQQGTAPEGFGGSDAPSALSGMGDTAAPGSGPSVSSPAAPSAPAAPSGAVADPGFGGTSPATSPGASGYGPGAGIVSDGLAVDNAGFSTGLGMQGPANEGFGGYGFSGGFGIGADATVGGVGMGPGQATATQAETAAAVANIADALG